MRVVQVSNSLPQYHTRTGGAEQACWGIAILLAKKNWEVVLITRRPERKAKSNFNVIEIPVIEDYLNGLRRYIEVLKSYILQFDVISFNSFQRALRHLKPALVHLHNFWLLTFSLVLAAKKAHIPVCLSVYDYWYFCPLSTLFDCRGRICRRFHGLHCLSCLPRKLLIVQGVLLLFRRKLFDFFLGKIDNFAVLSKSSAEILEAYGIKKEKISVVPLFLPDDFGEKDPAVPLEKNSVLFVGWLQKRKGLHLLLEAMQSVWRKINEAKLYIVVQEVKWEEEYRKDILAKLRTFSSEEYHLITGQRPRQEIKELIGKANVVVVPEQWENMSPVVIIEAMALGKPIVASRIGGTPEFIEDGKEGLLASYWDADDFADKIVRILENEEEAKIMGLRAKEKIRSLYRKDTIFQKLTAVYEKIIR